MSVTVHSTLRPQVLVSPRGTRRSHGNPIFVTSYVQAYNNDPASSWWSPGTVIVTLANSNDWTGGAVPAAVDPKPILVVGTIGTDPSNYATQPLLGVCLDYVTPGSWGRVATGGIVPVRCRDVTAGDPTLGTPGTWVRVSADADDGSDDGWGGFGVVESVSPTQLVSATANTSTPGAIVGQVVVGAGVGAHLTGSNYVAIVMLKLR